MKLYNNIKTKANYEVALYNDKAKFLGLQKAKDISHGITGRILRVVLISLILNLKCMIYTYL